MDPETQIGFGNAVVSDHGTLSNIGLVRAETAYIGASILPASRTGFFSNVPNLAISRYVERPALYDLVVQQLRGDPDAPANAQRSHVVVLRGIGGAGKTQLLLHYIQRNESDYASIFWISLVSKGEAEKNVRLIYEHLIRPKTSLEGKYVVVPLDEMMLSIQNWFHGKSGRYLWILDNADNIEDSSNTDFIDLHTLIPQSKAVRVILTTRNAGIEDMATGDPIEVEGMDPQQALRLFWQSSKITNPSPANVKTANTLIASLGYLALAISIAGALISKSRSMRGDIATYLDQFNSNKNALFSKAPDYIITRYNKSILTSWETSYDVIAAQHPVAAKLLSFLSMLYPNDIMRSMFERTLRSSNDGQANKKSWRIALEDKNGRVDFSLVESGFAVLESFSLLKYSETQDSYTMHKLIHEWSFERLNKKDRAAYGRAACAFLGDVASSFERDPNPNLSSRLCEHLMSCFEKTSLLIASETPTVARWYLSLYLSYTSTLMESSSLQNPKRILDFLLANRETLDEAGTIDKKQVVWTLCYLLLLHEQHDELEATAVVAIRGEREGNDPPSKWTTSMKDMLIRCLLNQGKVGVAASLIKEWCGDKSIYRLETLEDVELLTRYGTLFEHVGNWAEAIAIQERVVEGAKRILGDTSDMTARAVHILAHRLITHGRQGNQVDKERICDRLRYVVTVFEGGMGKKHSWTVAAKINLAASLVDVSGISEAITICRELQKEAFPILTRADAEGYLVRTVFGGLLNNLELREDSLEVYKSLVKDLKSNLGPEHAKILTVQEYMAGVMTSQDRHQEAAEMYEKVLEVRERVEGPEHPNYIATNQKLGESRKHLSRKRRRESTESPIAEEPQT